jgi:hypothetical protein
VLCLFFSSGLLIKCVTLELFADLGALGNYPGSPFLPSDSEILLDSPENEDIGKGHCIFYIIIFLLILFFNSSMVVT